MSKPEIKAVLFDLGETLLTFGRLNRSLLFSEAVERSYRYLTEHGQPVGSFGAYRLFYWWGLRWAVLKSWITGNDFNSLQLLKEYGRKRGFTLSESQWEELNWQWYLGLCDVCRVTEGTRQALESLQQMGLKLGLLSNTFIHKSSLERHLRQHGLLDFLPVRVYTYEYPWRKPDERIFKEAAQQIRIDCDNIIYVGDRVDNDVVGARKVGMLPVLVRAYTNETREIPSDVAYIDCIAELPEWIKNNCFIKKIDNEIQQHQPSLP